MSVTQLSERKKEPTPFQRFETALRAAMEAEGHSLMTDDLHRCASFLSRWIVNNVPLSIDADADDWRNSMAEGE